MAESTIGPTHSDPTPGSRIRHAYGECIRP